MPTQTAERQELCEVINTLSDVAIGKLANYIDFLRYEDRMEELEDAEDIAYIEACKDEPTISFEDVLAKHEAEHGPLD